MKKILFLMLSLAVASSAIAGPVKHLKKAERQINASAVVAKAPVLTYDQSIQKFKSNAPMVQKQLGEMIPCENSRQIEKSSLRAVVTETPAGTPTQYLRAGNCLTLTYDSSDGKWYYTMAEQGGVVDAVVDGNTIWFKNLMYDPEGKYPDNWVYGTKDGNTITVPEQNIYYSDYYSAYVNIIRGSTYTYGGNLYISKNTNYPASTFTVNGDVLTLDNANTSANYTGNGIITYWTDDNTFGGLALYNTTLTNTANIPDAPVMYTDDDIDAMTGEYVQYYRDGYAFFYDEEEDQLYRGQQYNYAWIFYANNGDVYMRNPVYGFEDDTWVKGSISGNKITVPLGQYLRWNSNTFYGVKTAWGEATQDDEGYWDFTQNTAVTEVTYTIDGKTITLDGTSEYVGLATVVDSALVDIDNNWFPNLDYSTTYWIVEEAPENVTVNPGVTTAVVSWEDEGNSQWILRYREYEEGEGETGPSYFNDFEESLAGWGYTDADGDGACWGWYSDPTDNTNAGIASQSYNKAPDNWMFSCNVVANGVVRMNAWGYNGTAAGSEEVFSILVARDTAQYLASFVPIAEDVTTDGDKTKVYTFDIPEEYLGDSICVAIRHTGGNGYLFIDNFFVGSSDTETHPWIYVDSITEIPCTIEGLTPETTYEVQVAAVNEGGVGEYTESTIFTTLASTPQPTLLRGDVDGNGVVGMDDLAQLINYLAGLITLDDINVENAAICDSLDSDGVGMDDLVALINYLVFGHWD